MFPTTSALGYSPSQLQGMTSGSSMGSTGNSMTDFLNGINRAAYSATHLDNGSDVISWANGLAQQAAQRKQQQAQQQQSGLAGLLGANGTDGSSMTQIFQWLMTLLSSMKAS